ncbi:hypothetical protein CDAR_387761 [Caerostris darwini]|uniref:Uncharacterized protein n=1 Tax=Caerostris darwini TaxID=1538125 RepID=A0AAV4STF9_9ARAC|nr:hypothetical protein CDAR_387761 [Caerostris darwini]
MSPCGQTIAPILMKFTRRFTVCCSNWGGAGVGGGAVDGGAGGVEFQSGYSSQILLCCREVKENSFRFFFLGCVLFLLPIVCSPAHYRIGPGYLTVS